MNLSLSVIRGGLFDLHAELLDWAFYLPTLPGARADRRVFLVDRHFLGVAQVLNLYVLKFYAQILCDGLPTGENGNVLKHGLAAVAEARGFHRRALQRAAQLIHHQRGQGLALNFFSNDQQRLAQLGRLFEQRQQILHRADFLLVDQNICVLQHAFHPFRIGDEIRRKVAAVELHAFDYFKGGLHRLGFLDGDDAILADLLHGFGDDAADLLVVVGGNGADLGDHVALDVLVKLLDLFDGHFDGALDTALESGRAGAGGDSLDALAEDGLCEHGRGGRAVTGNVGSLGSDFADHLRAHVLEGIAEFDFFRHGHAVLGNDRRAELLLDHP